VSSDWPPLMCSHCDREARTISPRPLCAACYGRLARNGTTERRPTGPPPPGEWVADAACRGDGVSRWFPERGTPINDLRAICNTCPVKAPCLEYALSNYIPHGIWGGMSERQRRSIRRRRNLGAA